MKTRAPTLLALVCSMVLSCSVFEPPRMHVQTEAALAPAVEGEAHPTAVEWVEARFHAFHVSLSAPEIREVAETVVAEAQAHDMSWELVLAVIYTESGFHNFAVSHVGALGLMQIMPRTGALLAREHSLPWEGRKTLFEPVVNVKMGTRYLSFLHHRYGDWDQALAAYNWGPANIDSRLRHGRALPVVYPSKVLAQLQSPLEP